MLLVRYSEIGLKGANQNYFIKILVSNIKQALSGYSGVEIASSRGRISIRGYSIEDEAAMVGKLSKVFGIASIAIALECEPSIASIKDLSIKALPALGRFTFKVETNRADKRFPAKSPQVSSEVGAHVIKMLSPNASVDVHNPDIVLNIDIREEAAYIYWQASAGEAGLPLGSSGKGAVLLSGGIDSPVASYMMARRGMKLSAIHYHSYPFTSVAAQDKARDISKVISEYNQGMDLYNVNAIDFMQSAISNCKEQYLTILLRRFMYRVAEAMKSKIGFSAIITGESLGQVASQTIESINCTQQALIETSVMRPLIGIDKNEITLIAKRIGTYDISIRPYDDCCTVFVPKHPQTRPVTEKVAFEEGKLDMESLVGQALEKTDLLTIKWPY
ncbi:MAG: tRNA 4-thiouridine(8) synthase ThiI [Eubacteriaceae bacterium]|nr:tRNA 4-thiouridine(8) synthase ThiI [Eubacteriaceae bacterium]